MEAGAGPRTPGPAVLRTHSPRAIVARAPLWLRLVAGTLLLVTLALVLTGSVGTWLLHRYLMDRVDRQLAMLSGAATQSESVREFPVPERLPPPPVRQGAGRLGGPYLAEIRNQDGQVVRRLAEPIPPAAPSGLLPDLSGLTGDEVERRAGEPFTVGSVDGSDHRWRVVARPLSSGYSIVVAMGLDDVYGTVNQLVFINVVAGVAVLAALGLAGYGLVRVSLRPLAEIETTAEAIARGDLSSRVPARDPRSELGRLGRSLNWMLTQIESAFRARETSEAASRRSELAARRSEDRMRRFVADASHELRTPLTSIRGFAELYRQEGAAGPEEAARLIRHIEEEAARMGLLVDDLLLLARLDQRRPLDRQPVDLVSLAALAVLDARSRAADRPIDLARLGDHDHPVTVLGDEPRLRQVVDNLISNALKHTPPGTRVRVGVGAAVRDGRELAVLEVTDEGPGLSPEDAERVFERFYRAEPSRSRTHGGAGLGLSIVAALTRAHGGTVELDTARGEGATFRVLIPYD